MDDVGRGLDSMEDVLEVNDDVAYTGLGWGREGVRKDWVWELRRAVLEGNRWVELRMVKAREGHVCMPRDEETKRYQLPDRWREILAGRN